MPDCQMCWNEWPTLTETPFPELAGIAVCRNCSRSMKQMTAFCRNHGLVLISVSAEGATPQVGPNSDPVTAEPSNAAASGDEPPQPPRKKAAGKA